MSAFCDNAEQTKDTGFLVRRFISGRLSSQIYKDDKRRCYVSECNASHPPEICEFIAEARRVARLGKTRIHVIYQRSAKYVAFGVSTSRINRRMGKLLDILWDDSKVRSQTRQ